MSNALLVEAVRLGSHAKGYVFGAEGPYYYDCSGLQWRAAENIKVYDGPRFSTYTILHDPASRKQFDTIPAADKQIGDLVVWSENSAHGHMGVVSGMDQFYSAESEHAGIGYQRISTFHVYPVKPVYLRPIKSAPARPPVPVTHRVQSGDSMFSIAKNWGVTLTALEKANPTSGHPAGNFALILPGDVIRHP